MAKRNRYQIKVQGELVEVNEEIYRAYYQVDRHTRTLDEKDTRNGKVLYSDLDTEEILGEEMIPDLDAPQVEDVAFENVFKEDLRRCIPLLSYQEQDLLWALYYKGLSERAYAKEIGISQKGVNKRRKKVIERLRAMMKIS